MNQNLIQLEDNEFLEKTILNKDWRTSHLYYIVDKSGDRILFKRNNIQQLIKKSKAKRKMILKARQFGVTTACLIDMLDEVMFTANRTAAVIAHNYQAVLKLFRIIRRAYEFFDPDLCPPVARGGGSVHELFFPQINSRIYADTEIRGDTVQNLHISEAAFMQDDSRLKASLQAVPVSGKVTIETTANGMGNHFYDMWNDPGQPYEKLFYPWFMFDEYKMKTLADGLVPTAEEEEMRRRAFKNYNVKVNLTQLAFRRLKKSELKVTSLEGSKITFEQEYPEDDRTCFLSSGRAIFDLLHVKNKMDKSNPPITDNGYLRTYYPIDRGRRYVCGADTAEGVNQDYSTAVMIEVESRRVVATLRSSNWKPSEFAAKLVEICAMYTTPKIPPPLLAVERNNHGHAVIQMLDESLGYQNMYRHKDNKVGWRTDIITRPIMLNAFIDAIESNYLEVNDKNIFNECLTLVNNKGKIEAASSKHDDMIIATAIALQLLINSSNLTVYENIENKILV
jgi:hypothetical protein